MNEDTPVSWHEPIKPVKLWLGLHYFFLMIAAACPSLPILAFMRAGRELNEANFTLVVLSFFPLLFIGVPSLIISVVAGFVAYRRLRKASARRIVLATTLLAGLGILPILVIF